MSDDVSSECMLRSARQHSGSVSKICFSLQSTRCFNVQTRLAVRLQDLLTMHKPSPLWTVAAYSNIAVTFCVLKKPTNRMSLMQNISTHF